ncbi:hypothetical protein BZL35_00263 [Candidatus Pandoraea novymonadis]|uniref:Uncharacterized protein n=1 Tax=Candidatus Pandoraea novymonadis TaxID=1808959 RepID=A0ABX5FFK5_9BURK|nr:hypothetical protein BZL35_00263 [Candidatus Pandoraea novymonadis]
MPEVFLCVIKYSRQKTRLVKCAFIHYLFYLVFIFDEKISETLNLQEKFNELANYFLSKDVEHGTHAYFIKYWNSKRLSFN